MTHVHSAEAEPGSVGLARGRDQRPAPSPPPAQRSDRPPPASPKHAAALHLGAYLWFVLVAVYATWPLARHAGSHVAGNLGDPLELAWRFAWAAHALVHQPLQLFDANMFHPEPLTLAYSENHLGVSLLLAPLFWATGNALVVYNTEVVLVLAAGGFGVYLLTWDVTRVPGAALVAGTAYTAVPFRVSMAALGHAHVLALHLAPLVLMVLLRLRRQRTWPMVATLALLVAASWWSSFTGALMTMVGLGTWGVWEAVRLRRRAWPLLWRAGVGTAAGLVAALPVIWPYIEVRQLHPGYRHAPGELIELSATAGTYLHPPPGGPVVRPVYQELSDRFRPARAASEKQLFPGFVLLGACAVTAGAAALVAARRRARSPRPPGRLQGGEVAGLMGAVALVAVMLSFGPRYGARPDGLPMPFAAVNALIPGGLMRAPVRIGALALLAMAVLAGIGLSWVALRRRRLLVAGSLVLLLVEFAPVQVGLVEAPARTAAHEAVAGRAGAVLGLPTVEFDDDGGIILASLPRESQHLYLSTAHFRPLTNGWGAYYPSDAITFARAMADIPSSGALRSLRARDVRTVVVQTNLTPGTRWDGVEDRLAAWPGVRLIARGTGVVVYDVSATQP